MTKVSANSSRHWVRLPRWAGLAFMLGLLTSCETTGSFAETSRFWEPLFRDSHAVQPSRRQLPPKKSPPLAPEHRYRLLLKESRHGAKALSGGGVVALLDALKLTAAQKDEAAVWLPPNAAIVPDRPRVWLESVPKEQFSTENPKPLTLASLRRGMTVYRRLCIECHGAYGEGSGNSNEMKNPIFRGLGAKPLHKDGKPTLPDGVIVWVVANGIDGTLMKSASHVVSEEEAWDLTNYIHLLAEDAHTNTTNSASAAKPLVP